MDEVKESINGGKKRTVKKILGYFLLLICLVFLYFVGSNLFFKSKIPLLIVIPVTLEKGTYELGTSVVLPTGSLSVKEGADIKALPGAQLILLTDTWLKGSEQNPIKISGENWKGINSRSSKLTMENVQLSGALNAVKSHGGTVEVNNCSFTKISRSCFSGNHGSEMTINNSVIEFQEEIGNINVNMISVRGGVLNLTNSILKCPKTARKIDCVDLGECKSGNVEGNVFIGTDLKDTDGVDLDGKTANVTVSNNLIYGFDDKAVSVGDFSSCKVFNNVFANCGTGIGVKDGSAVDANNNTYLNIGIGIRCYVEKIKDDGSSPPTVNLTKELFVNVPELKQEAGQGSKISLSDFLEEKIEGLNLKLTEEKVWKLQKESFKNFGAELDLKPHFELFKRMKSFK